MADRLSPRLPLDMSTMLDHMSSNSLTSSLFEYDGRAPFLVSWNNTALDFARHGASNHKVIMHAVDNI